jgi:[acyl-carrier-protein] S-malonyltransferase
VIDPGGRLRSAVSGTPLGVARPRREEVHVSARCDGVLAEEPAHDGDLGDAGDPIARPYPEVSA